MVNALPELVLAPILVACSTVVGRRWGQPAGGVVSAFPAVVGPVLLITADQHGAAFTARAANGTLLGLATLAIFAYVYARTAGRASWGASLAGGWLCAGALAVPVGWMSRHLGFPGGPLVAMVSLFAAYWGVRALTPEAGHDPRSDPGLAVSARSAAGGPGEIALRMVLTTALVAALAAAAGRLGPLVGGMLAGLPVLASVLAARTHRREGGAAAVDLLRGMLSGMSGFVGFCVVVALLIGPAGTPVAFGVAAVVAITLQIGTFDRGALIRASHRAAVPAPAGARRG